MTVMDDAALKTILADAVERAGLTISAIELRNGIGPAWAAAAFLAMKQAVTHERTHCANIALANDSGRGNEKEIARAIQAQG